jgi:hypothetical protein
LVYPILVSLRAAVGVEVVFVCYAARSLIFGLQLNTVLKIQIIPEKHAYWFEQFDQVEHFVVS